jgi:hypothetical protein
MPANTEPTNAATGAIQGEYVVVKAAEPEAAVTTAIKVANKDLWFSIAALIGCLFFLPGSPDDSPWSYALPIARSADCRACFE